MPGADCLSIRRMYDTCAVTPHSLRFHERKALLLPARAGSRLRLILRRSRDLAPILSGPGRVWRWSHLARMEARLAEPDDAITGLRDRRAEGVALLAGQRRASAG